MVYVLAIAASFFYGLAAVLQHREAIRAPEHKVLRMGLLVHLAQRPMWTAGVGCDVVAFFLQAGALEHGPLTLVQPLLTTGLLFSLLLAAVWERRGLTGAEWLATLALMGGLAVFLIASSPSPGRPVVHFRRWVGTGAILAAAVAVLVVVAQRCGRALKPVLLALATALMFAGTNTLMKGAVDIVHRRGFLHILHSPYLWALVVFAVLGTLLAMNAFQAGPLASSLPTLSAVEPVASSAIGVVLFAERLRTTPAAVVVEGAGIALMLGAIWVLGRSPKVTGLGSPRKEPAEIVSP